MLMVLIFMFLSFIVIFMEIFVLVFFVIIGYGNLVFSFVKVFKMFLYCVFFLGWMFFWSGFMWMVKVLVWIVLMVLSVFLRL